MYSCDERRARFAFWDTYAAAPMGRAGCAEARPTRPRRSSARRSFDFGLAGRPTLRLSYSASLERFLPEDQKESECGLYRRNVVFSRRWVYLYPVDVSGVSV